MMISPSLYISDLKHLPYDKLIEERRELTKEIAELEESIFNTDHTGSEWDYMPSPNVVYQVKLEYLSELCAFMQNKFNTEIVHGEQCEPLEED